jgi:hypothetical protein
MEEVRLSAQIVRRGNFGVEIFQFDEPRPMLASRSDVIGDLKMNLHEQWISKPK